MAAPQAAENHGGEWGLTWYFRWGIYASIPTWTHSQNSQAAAEAPSLKISFHRTSLKLKRCQVIASDKSNLLWRVDFLLKSGFQVIAVFLHLEVRYLVIIVVNFVYKWARQLFSGHHKKMSDSLILLEYFSGWRFNFIMVTWLYYFLK